MRHSIGASSLVVAAAILLIQALRIVMAVLTEVSIASAAESSYGAAIVTLKLQVAQPMLLAHEMLANAMVCHAARLAQELVVSEHGLLSSLVIDLLLNLTVDETTEVGCLTPVTLIEFTHRERILVRILVISTFRIADFFLDVVTVEEQLYFQLNESFSRNLEL